MRLTVLPRFQSSIRPISCIVQEVEASCSVNAIGEFNIKANEIDLTLPFVQETLRSNDAKEVICRDNYSTQTPHRV